MQIKTVRWKLDAGDRFDEEVNDLLKAGWHLEKRYIIPTMHNEVNSMLIAEMVKFDPDDARPEKPKATGWDRIAQLLEECEGGGEEDEE